MTVIYLHLLKNKQIRSDVPELETARMPTWDRKSSFCDKQSQMNLGEALAIFCTWLIFVLFPNKTAGILKNLEDI